MNKKNIQFPSEFGSNTTSALSVESFQNYIPVKGSSNQGTAIIEEVIPASFKSEIYDFATAADIMTYLQISRSSAYKLISKLNKELENMGLLTFPGKIPWQLLRDHMYPENLIA